MACSLSSQIDAFQHCCDGLRSQRLVYRQPVFNLSNSRCRMSCELRDNQFGGFFSVFMYFGCLCLWCRFECVFIPSLPFNLSFTIILLLFILFVLLQKQQFEEHFCFANSVFFCLVFYFYSISIWMTFSLHNFIYFNYIHTYNHSFYLMVYIRGSIQLLLLFLVLLLLAVAVVSYALFFCCCCFK